MLKTAGMTGIVVVIILLSPAAKVKAESASFELSPDHSCHHYHKGKVVTDGQINAELRLHSHEYESGTVWVFVVYFNGVAHCSFTRTSGVLMVTCTKMSYNSMPVSHIE